MNPNVLAVAKSVVGPARTEAEHGILKNIIRAQGANDIAAFIRSETKICESAKKKLPLEQYKRLILAFDYIKSDGNGKFDEKHFRVFRLLRKGLCSSKQSGQQNTPEKTSPQQDDDDGFFLAPQLFQMDKTDEDVADDDGVSELMELKGFKVGFCYQYQINDKTCIVAIRSFSSDEQHANCVLVVPLSETFLGQSHECNDDYGNLNPFPRLEWIYGSKFVQVAKKVKPVPLDPSSLTACMEPKRTPRVVYEPSQDGKRLNFGYHLFNDGSNIVGRRSDAIGYVDLCCGAGGAHQGYRDHGISTLMAVDLDETAIETFKRNNEESADATVVGDIESLLESTEFEKLRPHVIHLSAPNRGYTAINRNEKETEEDKKNNELALKFVEFLDEKRPSIAVFQSVPGMWRAKDRRYLLRILHGIVSLGYQFRVMILRDSEFGGPQKRPHLFIVAVKKYIPMPPCPSVTHVNPKQVETGQNKPWVTCDNVLELIDLCREGTFPNQDGEKDRRQLSMTPGEQKAFQLEQGGLAPGVRLSGSPVFHYRGDPDDAGHPRVISVRETAALQGFPDSYEFQGKSLTEKYKQAGNGVSCHVMRALVASFKPSLEVVYHEDYKQDAKYLGLWKWKPNKGKLVNEQDEDADPTSSLTRTTQQKRVVGQDETVERGPTKRARSGSSSDPS